MINEELLAHLINNIMMICSWVKIISLLYHVFCCPIANSVLLGLHFFFRKSRICGKELALSSLFFSAATSIGVMCFILSFQARFASTFACCSIFSFLRLSSLINQLINSAFGGPKNSLRCFQNGVCELCENMFISSIRVQVHCTVKITKNVLLQILYIFVEGMWPRP